MGTNEKTDERDAWRGGRRVALRRARDGGGFMREMEHAGVFRSGGRGADVSRCLRAGANVNARDEDGLTPLHAATAFSKTPAIVDALLKGGANVNARDRAGKMPFDYVKENSALKGTDAYWRLNEARFK